MTDKNPRDPFEDHIEGMDFNQPADDWHEVTYATLAQLAASAVMGQLHSQFGRQARDKWWMLLGLRFASHIRRESKSEWPVLRTHVDYFEGSRISGYALSTLRIYAEEHYDDVGDQSDAERTGTFELWLRAPEVTQAIDEGKRPWPLA